MRLLATFPVALFLSSCSGSDRMLESICAEKGGVPRIQPVVSRGVRFAPNQCIWEPLDDPVCSVGAYPLLHGQKLLVQGFEFAEFDIDKTNYRPGGEQFVGKVLRLRLVPRPSKLCEWELSNWRGGTPEAIESLAAVGIPSTSCIAAEWDVSPSSEYRFVTTTIKYPDNVRRRVRVNRLERTSDGSTLAELWTGGIEVGEYRTGSGVQSCGTYAQGVEFLGLVAPASAGARGR